MNLKRLARGFHEEEGGQVTILFVFASIGFILMLAFIINTAQQTSRKIEMQDAADATAVVGATWMARGMNLIAFDNKAMSDVVGMMIVVHAAREAADVMPGVVIAVASALELASFFTASGIVAEMYREAAVWPALSETLDGIDDSFQDAGWSMMSALSGLNVAIADLVQEVASVDGAYYAIRNGLPNNLGGFLPVPIPLVPLPSLPVMRAGKERLVIHANGEDPNTSNCCIGILEPAMVGAMGLMCLSYTLPLTYPLWIPLFLIAVPINVASLEGGAGPGQYFQYTQDTLQNLQNTQGQSVGSMLNTYNNQQGTLPNGGKPVNFGNIASQIGSVAVGLDPLEWPDDPPLPMVLTDTGNPGDSQDSTPPPVDLLKVRQRLQYVAVNRAPSKFNGYLAGQKFVNPSGLFGWVTYAEGDVYNPVYWDTFQQTWRARLARSSLGSFFGVDTSFVNNH